MRNPDKNYFLLFLLSLFVIGYLLVNTGIISDDFDIMSRIKGKAFKDVLTNFYFIETPFEHFTHFIWYYFFRLDNPVAENIMKTLYIALSLCLISKFFQLYLNKRDALLVSFLFIPIWAMGGLLLVVLPQIINKELHKVYYEVLKAYYILSGIPSLINTSFNYHEEPIICDPEQAVGALKNNIIDVLAMPPFILIQDKKWKQILTKKKNKIDVVKTLDLATHQD